MNAPLQVMNGDAHDAVVDVSRKQRARRQPVEGPRHARATARAVGILMLAGFLTYGVGSAIATTIAGSADARTSNAAFAAGTLSMLLNSAVVISMGVLMFPILQRHNRPIALSYLFTRLWEGVGLAIGVVSLISLTGPAAIDANFLAYNIAMAGLGIGSLFFCSLLFRSRLVPRFLAAWGFIGYATMAAGCFLELLGFAGAGIVSVIPGGLFEVAFGVWLIARGFNPLALHVNRTEQGRP
jgi:hypothetical protein